MTISLTSLLAQVTRAQFYQMALDVAEAVGLPVTSWGPGDPTRSDYHFLSRALSELEEIRVSLAKSGFLDHATGDWLKLKAEQDFNYTPDEATYATATVKFTNAGGGIYDEAAGDVTVKCTATGKTYHTTEALVLNGVGTASILVEADEAGSDSNASTGQIDAMVTTLLGVTCESTTAAVAMDEESEEDIRAGCRAKLGTLSANGPWDGYAAVALDNDLTGATTVARCRVYDESTTGDVVVYVANTAGESTAGDVTLVQNAILLWATPLCMTPAVYAASASTINISYTAQAYLTCGYTEAECKALIAAKLAELFAAIPIGGDSGGKVYHSAIVGAIYSAIPGFIHYVKVDAPATDTTLTNSQVAVLGTITADVDLVAAP